ncbi:MAG: hypothetical protein Q9219_002791 [cf. Caloplaca sp. 3 TL-2023]
MADIAEHSSTEPSQEQQWPLKTNSTDPTYPTAAQSLKDNPPELKAPSAYTPPPASYREPLATMSVNAGTTIPDTTSYPLTREKTGPAIGPPIDTPVPNPHESDSLGFSLFITLLLISGARHPFRIDEKYMKKRNVNVDGNNPVYMSVYTLKELIWREWRDDWEMRPSSPSSIRLIYFGKLLEDKSRLHDCRFEAGPTPHVVHMTVKPQEIVDEEDAKMAKTGSRDRDGTEGGTGCRCTIL